MTGAKVKQLDWHNFDAWTYWAEAVCGTYHVEERNGWWQVEVRFGGLVHVVAVTDDTLPADLEAAKAAAQADYTARILAALTPTAVDASLTADPAVKALDDLAQLGQECDAAPDPACDHCGMDPAAIREAALEEAALEQALSNFLATLRTMPESKNLIDDLIPKGAAE